jgi:ferredoxin-NADP reductase
VDDVQRATPRALIVRLDLDDQLFEYAPGQAVFVGPHDGERRPYSLASAPDEARRARALELLMGTDQADSRDEPYLPRTGELVDVDGPVGGFIFPAHPAERRFLFIAGGTGIAPLRAMLRHALHVPHDGIALLYSARTPDEFAFGDELSALARDGRIQFRRTITRSTAADWEHDRGRVTRATLAPLVHDLKTLCFVCGPQPLVEEARRLLLELGVERSRIRTEEQ